MGFSTSRCDEFVEVLASRLRFPEAAELPLW